MQNQFSLLTKKKFVPFFITQALGAFNDNVFKNALMLLLAFDAASKLPLDTNFLMNLAAGLFILPFLLFSGIAGRIADKFDMDLIIRTAKIAEIFIMSSAALAFYFEAYAVLIFILFLMGTQSAFFGPVKYAILPRKLSSDELVGGNALVEMGTFVAILLGTIVGGLLVGLDNAGFWISASIVSFACIGYFSSRFVPFTAPANKQLTLSWNIFSQTWSTFKVSHKYHEVFLSMLAISWFWFMGASYLTQIPNYTKINLQGNNEVVTLLLAIFSIGVACGSLACEKLSAKKVELGLVPIGSIGLSIFGIHLFFSTPNVSVDELMGLVQFLQHQENFAVLMDFAFIGFFGGLYSVPLMAFVQKRSDDNEKAQTIAALNILNALFMVVSALSGILLLTVAQLSIPQYLLVIALMNIVVAVYIYYQVPEFFLRFIIYLLSHSVYRVKQEGLEHIPEHGAAMLVSNHVSYMDALIIAGACKRPLRFVMDTSIFHNPWLNWFFRLAKTIPIASQKNNPETYEAALKKISAELKQGNMVCIFPEGKLTVDGDIDHFRKGIETIIEKDPVPVIPIALQGLWGSYFSHKHGAALSTVPQRFWSRVNIVADEPWSPEDVSAKALEDKVKNLRGSFA